MTGLSRLSHLVSFCLLAVFIETAYGGMLNFYSTGRSAFNREDYSRALKLYEQAAAQAKGSLITFYMDWNYYSNKGT